MQLVNGSYKIQDFDVSSLALEFGTPLYVYDGHKIESQIHRLKSAFSSTRIRIKYAAKALTNISILKLVRKSGADVEVVSLQEAAMAVKAGFMPQEITFTPSGVDFAEIEQAVQSGFSINIDNLSSFKKFGEKYGSSYE